MNIIYIFGKGKKEDLGSSRTVSFTSVPGKVVEVVTLGTIFRHKEDKKVIRISQHGFTKKSYFTYLKSFYNVMTAMVDVGQTVSIIYMDFSRNSDTFSHKIITEKLMNNELDE